MYSDPDLLGEGGGVNNQNPPLLSATLLVPSPPSRMSLCLPAVVADRPRVRALLPFPRKTAEKARKNWVAVKNLN